MLLNRLQSFGPSKERSLKRSIPASFGRRFVWLGPATRSRCQTNVALATEAFRLFDLCSLVLEGSFGRLHLCPGGGDSPTLPSVEYAPPPQAWSTNPILLFDREFFVLAEIIFARFNFCLFIRHCFQYWIRFENILIIHWFGLFTMSYLTIVNVIKWT